MEEENKMRIVNPNIVSVERIEGKRNTLQIKYDRYHDGTLEEVAGVETLLTEVSQDSGNSLLPRLEINAGLKAGITRRSCRRCINGQEEECKKGYGIIGEREVFRKAFRCNDFKYQGENQ